MSKTYDALMELLEEKGSIPDEEAAKLIKEHGPLEEEEKKKIASAIKMAQTLNKTGNEEKDKAADKKEEAQEDEGEKLEEPSDDSEVSMDDYLLALSVLDSDEASKEEKEKAEKVKDKFESQ
ncbi:MAG: hypothetical protein JXB30_07720 [Anaerolineae bacterium]|nr:hypothetical protein [Anaerolineae bacterium]